ncbi:DUF3618 domain-containing protein [soil metagenome]
MDDTTRGLGDRDEFAGRSDESIRDYAGTDRDQTGTATPGMTAASKARVTRPSNRRKNESETVSSTNTGLDDDADRRTREIQQEIIETRVEMSETIDALQEKLKPANLVADATDRVKSATTEKVRHMAESASETAQEMYRSTSEGAYGMIEEVRNNPIPALMIGAGVAWMIMDRSRNRDSGDGYTRNSAWDGRSSRRYGASGSGSSRYGSDASYGGESASYGSGSARYGATAGESEDTGTGEGLTDRARETMNQARYATQRTTRRAQSQLQRMLNDNPLLIGAAAVVIGAAIGAALPETERENEWMGDARDSVIDRAQEMAQNAVGTVQEVAGDAAKEAVNRVVGSEKS